MSKKIAVCSVLLLLAACAGEGSVIIDSGEVIHGDAGVTDSGPSEIFQPLVDGGVSLKEDTVIDSGVSDAGHDASVTKGKTYLCQKMVRGFIRGPGEGTAGATDCSDTPAGIDVLLSYKLTAFSDGSIVVKADVTRQSAGATSNHYADSATYEAVDRGLRDGVVRFAGNICSGGEDKDKVPGAEGNWTFSIGLDSIPVVAGAYYTDTDLNGGSWTTIMDCE